MGVTTMAPLRRGTRSRGMPPVSTAPSLWPAWTHAPECSPHAETCWPKPGTGDFARRGYASAVLGSACANLNAAELWTTEEPESPDAWLLWARVAAIRALRAAD